MSEVTSVVLVTSAAEPLASVTALESWLASYGHGGFVDAAPSIGRRPLGYAIRSEKYPEVGVFVAGFDRLDVEAFLRAIEEVAWAVPTAVALVIGYQHYGGVGFYRLSEGVVVEESAPRRRRSTPDGETWIAESMGREGSSG